MNHVRRRGILNGSFLRIVKKAILADLSNVPSPPQQLAAVSGGAGTLNLTWADALQSNRTYQVYLNGALQGSTSATAYTLNGLSSGQTHKIEVTTTDTTTSAISDRTPAVMRQSTASDDSTMPPSFNAILVCWGGVFLNWADGSTVPAGGYQIYDLITNQQLNVLNFNNTGNNNTIAMLTAPNSTPELPVKLTGLNPGQNYELQLVAVDSNNNQIGVAPNTLLVNTYERELLLDYTPPSVPTNVTATAGNGSAAIAWHASSDSQSGVRGYNVFVNGLFAGQSSTTSCHVTGLTNGTSYQVSVLAFDEAGNPSAQSTAINVTPHANGTSYTATALTATFTQDSNGLLSDPSGNPFIPIGCNVNGPDFVWYKTPTVGQQSLAANNWHWTIVRLVTGYRDIKNGPYVFTQNNNIDAIISGYTALNIVVMVDFHFGLGTILSSTPGTMPDPSGRSEVQGVGDFWVEIAKKYSNNPYVWFNLMNEPAGSSGVPDAAAASTANVASLSGLQTIDTYTLHAGDIVLLLYQTTASQNGPWVASSGAWTRPAFYASGTDATNFIEHVTGGNTNNKTIWGVTGSGPQIIDTAATSFAIQNPGQALDDVYNTILPRIRTIAPRNTIVMDADNNAQDIPTSTVATDYHLVTSESFILTFGPNINSAWGQPMNYGPTIFSVHMYNRWSSSPSGGQLSSSDISSRITDFVGRVRAQSMTMMVGEMGNSSSSGFASNVLVTNSALYANATYNGQATGPLIALGVGVTPWHGDADSPAPMNVAGVQSPAVGWTAVTTEAQANASVNGNKATGKALWDYANNINI